MAPKCDCGKPARISWQGKSYCWECYDKAVNPPPTPAVETPEEEPQFPWIGPYGMPYPF